MIRHLRLSLSVKFTGTEVLRCVRPSVGEDVTSIKVSASVAIKTSLP